MLGVSAAHLGPYGGIARTPEARKVARDLKGAPRRGKQVHGDGASAIADRRAFLLAEHFLKLHRQHRPAFGKVVDTHVRPRGDGKVRGRFAVEPAGRGIGQKRVERLGKLDMRELRTAADAVQPRGQPAFRSLFAQGGQQGAVAHVGPFRIFPFHAAHEQDTGLPLAQLFRPRQAGHPEAGYAFQHGLRDGVGGKFIAAQGRVLKDERIQQETAAGKNAFRAFVPQHTVFTAQTPGVQGFERFPVQRGGKMDAPRAGGSAVHGSHGKEGGVGQSVFLRKQSAAPGSKAEGTAFAALGYAFRPCEAEKRAAEIFVAQGFFQGEAALRDSKGIDLLGGTAQAGVAAQFAKAGAQVAARAGTALLGEGGKGGGQRAMFSGRKDHVGKARVQGQAGQLFPMRGELGAAVLFVHGSQQAERMQGLCRTGLGGGGEEGQVLRQRAPCQHVQQEGGEVGFEDLGAAAGEQGVSFMPEPPARPLFDAACAACALVGGILRDTLGDKGAHARGGREARRAGQAGIHHDAHAFDGKAGLGYGGGKHHLAQSGRGWRYGGILFGGAQVAVQRVQARSGGKMAFQQFGHAAYLGLTGQEDQRRAAFFGKGAAHSGGAVGKQGLPPFERAYAAGSRARGMAERYGIGAAFGPDDRAWRKKFGNMVGIQRGRHDQYLQVGAQGLLGFEAEGEAGVGLKGALVELVEDDAGNAGKLRVADEAAGEDTLGYDLHAGLAAHAAFKAHAVAYALACAFAELGGHVAGGGTGGKAARLQHEDSPFHVLHEEERDARGLARAGRGCEQGAFVGSQGFQQGGERRFDGHFHAGNIAGKPGLEKASPGASGAETAAERRDGVQNEAAQGKAEEQGKRADGKEFQRGGKGDGGEQPCQGEKYGLVQVVNAVGGGGKGGAQAGGSVETAMEERKEAEQRRDGKGGLVEGVCPDEQGRSAGVLRQKEFLPDIGQARDKEGRTPRQAGRRVAAGGEPALLPCPCAEEEHRDVRGDAHRLEHQHIAVEGPCVGMHGGADNADADGGEKEEHGREKEGRGAGVSSLSKAGE